MSFTIPNKSIVYPMQSRIFQSDMDMLSSTIGGFQGVISGGCEVTETTPTPDLNVQVSTGQVVISYELIDVTGGTVAIADADPLLPRFDTIVASDDGSVAAITGLADAAPFPESPGAAQVGLGQVFVPAATSSISQGQIVDKRVFVPTPIAPAAWTLLSCATDLSRASNAAVSLDPILQFTVAANTTYRVRFGIRMFTTGTAGLNGGLQVRFTGPVSAGAGGHGAMLTGSTTGNIGPAQNMTITNGTLNFSGVTLAGSIQNNYPWFFEGGIVMTNGSTAGTFGFSWGQSQAMANPLVRYAGSWLEYEMVV